jgi:HAD superfamily hydrolase (TIGR01450 family)
MIGVILAAGRGTRLEAITRKKPKCLVHVNGRSILDRQIEALLAVEDIAQIIVLCGYRAAQIKSHLAHRYRHDSRLLAIENVDFATTNNMYSLFLAREHVAGRDLILMNADVAFDPAIIRDLSATSCSSICVDVGAYTQESMKVVRTGDHLTAISKTISQDASFGVSTDVYRFVASDTDILLTEVSVIVEELKNRNEWTELALDRLLQTGALVMWPFDIEGRSWYEIDNLEDLWRAEQIFARQEFDWDSVKLAFVDMDGTLFRGSQPIAGAGHFFNELTQRVPHVFLLSNNSSRVHAEYVTRLAGMGIVAEVSQILLSSDALIAFLKREGIRRVYAVGTDSFRTLLAEQGITHGFDESEAVVLGYDTELTYEKLRASSILLQDHAMPYYATHADITCPTEQGDIPDVGAMVALMEATTGRRPDYTFGKPDIGMVQHVFDTLQLPASASVFIGDRVYTDYAMADVCKARFVAVLTGDSDRADFEACQNITVLPSVAAVFTDGDAA